MKTLSLFTFFTLFALPAETVALPGNSVPVGGWLTIHDSAEGTNIRVCTVIPGESLDNAGLQPGDIITWCDDTEIRTVTNNVRDWFKKRISELNNRQSLTLICDRNGTLVTANVRRLPARPLKLLRGAAGGKPVAVTRALSLWTNDAALLEASVVSGLVSSCQIRPVSYTHLTLPTILRV